MLSSLMNVSVDMATKIASGLGMDVPKAMPKALMNPVIPEVLKSAPLSLTALPGDGNIRTHKVAILVADGVHGASVLAVQAALTAAGAVTWLIGPHLGLVKTVDVKSVGATGTFENSPPVLFDALVLPDGHDGVAQLAKYEQTREFITNQYRHCKTILVLGAAKALLDQAGIVTTLPSGQADPGIVLASGQDVGDSTAAFITAVGQHRHPARETDIPRI